MRKLLFLIFIFSIFSEEAFSGEAFFRPFSRKEISIKEGDSFKGVIELWKIENVSPEMISTLVGTTFLDYFYVVTLGRPRWSENNPEVVVIDGVFVLQNKIVETNKIWKHGGLQIPVTIKEIESFGLENKAKDFYIIEKEYNFEERDWKSYALVIILIFLVLLILIIMKRKKVDPKVPVGNINWDSKILDAKTKDDFSELYLNKKLWLVRLDGREEVAEDFLKCAELYLFKLEIADFEIQELKESLEKILKGMV